MQNQDTKRQFIESKEQDGKQPAMSRPPVLLPTVLYQNIIAEYLCFDDLMRLMFVLDEMGFTNVFPDTFWERNLKGHYDCLINKLKKSQDQKSCDLYQMTQTGQYWQAYALLKTGQISVVATLVQADIILGLVRERSDLDQRHYLKKCLSEMTVLSLRSAQLGVFEVKHLADAISSNQTLASLDLSVNQMRTPMIEHLAAMLEKNQTLLTLKLCDSLIDDVGAKRLAAALEVNQTLRNLYVSHEHLSNVAVEHLAKALQKNKALTYLYIGETQMDGVGAGHLAKALEKNETLMVLRIDGNHIGDLGAEHLAQALKENRTLSEIDLSRNQISLIGVQYLAEALEGNQTLMKFQLSGSCPIGDLGAKRLAKALEKNTTLTNLEIECIQIRDLGAEYLIAMLEKNQTITHLNLWGNNISVQNEKEIGACIRRNYQLRSRCIEALKQEDEKTARDLLSLGVSANGVLAELIRSDNDSLVPFQVLFQVVKNDIIFRSTLLKTIHYEKYARHLSVIDFLQSKLFRFPTNLEEKEDQILMPTEQKFDDQTHAKTYSLKP